MRWGILHENLPYNLNWQSINWGPLHRSLSDHPIQIVDVGARGGSPQELKPLFRYLDVTAFDADQTEVDRLNSRNGSGHRGYRALPLYVGGTTGQRTFNIYRHKVQSSALLPSKDYQDRFEPELEVAGDVTVQSTTLEALATAGEFREVDVLKLDTQGSEYDILLAAPSVLEQALLVEVEVSFVERYQGQRLAFDIQRLMHERGFELLYLNRIFRTRRRYRGRARGQLIFGEMLFVMSEGRAHKLSPARKFKLIVLLIQYGAMDFAHALYSNASDVQKGFPELGRYFSPVRGFFGTVRAVVSMQLDKLIVVLLRLRRTNGSPNDTDRAWPVR